MTHSRVETVVVGAGAAGLAVAACLRRAGLPFTILEQNREVGSAWRGRYDRLHLHTDKGHSQLPLAGYPKDYPRYPSRLQVIRYLKRYAERFQLAPRFGQRVVVARRHEESWETVTPDARYRSTNLVVCTGHAREPVVPRWPGQETFPGPVFHSSTYENGRPFSGKRVLVVGFGNSGGEIAIDLCEHDAEPSIAVRSPVNVLPRELCGIPILAISAVATKVPPRFGDALTAPILRFLYGDLARYGLRRMPYGPLTQVRRNARIPLIDVGTMELIRQGRIRVRSGIECFVENEVQFSDGRREPYDAVVLATGYRPQVGAFLRDVGGALDAAGTPITSGEEAMAGLFFCGFYVSPSGMLRQIAHEAKRVSKAIAAKSRSRPETPSAAGPAS